MLFPSIRTQIILVVLFTLSATGCESIRYYGQAIHGQISILNKREPIDRLLAESETPDKLKVKLRQVLRIREFAENELHLPADKNYLSFVELERPFVVWNVFAASEFSFTPKTWCFPIVGCTSYRGYFSKKYGTKLDPINPAHPVTKIDFISHWPFQAYTDHTLSLSLAVPML